MARQIPRWIRRYGGFRRRRATIGSARALGYHQFGAQMKNNDKSQDVIRDTQTDTGSRTAEKLDFDATPATDLQSHPVRADLADLRCNMPFVPVVPFPKASYRIDLAGAGDRDEILIPDQAVLMKVSAVGAFFMSINGLPDGRTSKLAEGDGNDRFSGDQLVTEAATDWLYVAGLKTIGVRTIGAANKIGARFIYRDQI